MADALQNGRELGKHGLDDYLEEKSVSLNLS
jgi:hypothetical protein